MKTENNYNQGVWERNRESFKAWPCSALITFLLRQNRVETKVYDPEQQSKVPERSVATETIQFNYSLSSTQRLRLLKYSTNLCWCVKIQHLNAVGSGACAKVPSSTKSTQEVNLMLEILYTHILRSMPPRCLCCAIWSLAEYVCSSTDKILYAVCEQ